MKVTEIIKRGLLVPLAVAAGREACLYVEGAVIKDVVEQVVREAAYAVVLVFGDIGSEPPCVVRHGCMSYGKS